MLLLKAFVGVELTKTGFGFYLFFFLYFLLDSTVMDDKLLCIVICLVYEMIVKNGLTMSVMTVGPVRCIA